MKDFKELPSDLLVILTWVLLTLVFIAIPVLADTFVRTLLGIPVVLFIPGYVLIAALFPRKKDLEFIERITLSFGLSIAVVPLLGLLLNFTFGIKLFPILITLCLYTLSLTFIAAYRREKLNENEQYSVSFRIYEIINNEIKNHRSGTDKILTLLLIFLLVVAVGMVYFVIATPKSGERFTEFYILNASGKSDNYPTNLKYNSPCELMVGVVNHEYAPVNYTIKVALEGEVLNDTNVMLYHNETWEKNMTFVPNKEGNDTKLEFLLFKENNFTSPYRELHLWVNITK